MATHSIILFWVTKSWTRRSNFRFPSWEDVIAWAHWNHSFHMHLSYLGWASYLISLSDIRQYPMLFLFWVLSSSVLTWIPPHREWLQPHGWVTAGIVLLPECPGWAGIVMTVTSLFIDMAGILHVSAASFCSLKSSYLTLRRAFWTERTLYT